MNLKKLYRRFFIVLVVFVICFVILVVFLRWKIQSALDQWCATAQAAHHHPGDAVAALLEYVESDLHTLRERNSAVWALGQVRDSRAL